jgi:hypothetical protein
MRLAGVRTGSSHDIDGMDLSDFLLGRPSSPVTELHYERDGKIIAFRKVDWKIVRVGAPDDPAEFELYNLKWDISEKYNVADLYPEIAEDLIIHLD